MASRFQATSAPPSKKTAILSKSFLFVISLISCAISGHACQGVATSSTTIRSRQLAFGSIYRQRDPRSCSILRRQFLAPCLHLVSIHTQHSQLGGLIRRSSNDIGSNYSAENISESAPSVVGVPTTKQLLTFVFTTVLVWTSEPLLSLVDSATVGTYASRTTQLGTTSLASVVQLAALGPATMLCDSSIFLTYFIGLAATNKLARASAKKDWKTMIEISSHSLGVSVILGVLVTISLFLFGEPLLRSIVGPEGAIFKDVATKTSVDLTGEVVHIALGYTWIRAVAAIFAITGSTAQSLLLCEFRFYIFTFISSHHFSTKLCPCISFIRRT